MDNFMALMSSNQKSVVLPKSSKVIDGEADSKINTKDFISILFSQIQNSSNSSVKANIEIPINIKTSEKTLSKDKKPISSNELLLGEILNIVNLLKGGEDKVSFPKFSDKLDKILNDKSVLNDFKNIKNLDDIFDISKKYDLGLKNIKLTEENIITLKKDFPKLDSKNFFEVKTTNKNHTNDEQNTVSTKSKKYIAIEKLIQNLANTQNEEQPKNILQSLLKDSGTDTQKALMKNIEEDKKIKVERYIKEDKKTDTKQHTDKKSVDYNEIKNKNLKETSDITQKEIKTFATNTKRTIATEISGKEIFKSVKKEDVSKKIAKDKEVPTNKTMIGNIKQEKIQTHKGLQDRILDKIIVQKSIKTQDLNNTQTLTTDDKVENAKDTKTEPISHKQEFSHTLKIDTSKSNKNIETKNSINHFSNDLKEKMENYKPPIMKIKMALNPKNLGEVEVTLLQRGNNLHVNITSNTNTMSLFTQNQTEFKNSLVNMGFTNLEMNFSDQGKNSQQDQQNRKNNNGSFEEFNTQENHESAIELIVPKYI